MSKNTEASKAFQETFEIAMEMSNGDRSYSLTQAADAFELVAGPGAIPPDAE